MNRRFNMFYHGPSLSLLEWLCMESFVNHGHELCLHLYEDVEAPEGVVKVDARATLPFSEFFMFDGSPSAFTNIFRYKLILETGGWWVDTDVLCLNNNLPECEYAWANQDPSQINGAILKFPQGDSLCQKLLELSIERSRSLTAWGQLGPGLLTEVLSGAKPAGHFGSQAAFYPTHWLEAHLCWMQDQAKLVQARLDGASFLHLWNSILNRMGINLNKRPPPGSYFENLLADRFDLEEAPDGLREEILNKIRINLDMWSGRRSLYEEQMGRNWDLIYPEAE
jgi:hypothetical protein